MNRCYFQVSLYSGSAAVELSSQVFNVHGYIYFFLYLWYSVERVGSYFYNHFLCESCAYPTDGCSFICGLQRSCKELYSIMYISIILLL